MAEKYISVEALFEKTTRRNHIWDAVTNAEGKGLTEIMNDIPPADVQPVVRATWVPGKELSRSYIVEYGIERCISIEYDKFTCSNCGFTMYVHMKPKDKFCKECGADMRPVPPEREVEA